MNYTKIKGMSSVYSKIYTESNYSYAKINSQKFPMIFDGTYYSPGVVFLLNYPAIRMIDSISINTFNGMNYAALVSSNRIMEEIIDEKRTVKLDKEKESKVKLDDALYSRHSVRHFDPNYVLSFGTLSSILNKSFGISDKRMYLFDDVKTPCRNYGSGGGLYPIDVYLLIKNCEKLKEGFYKYQPYSKSLFYIGNNTDFQEIIIGDNFDFNSINFGVFYSYSLSRNYIKYGELGILAAAVEIGLMSQNFELISTSYGLGTCQIAGFDKKLIEKQLGLDGFLHF